MSWTTTGKSDAALAGFSSFTYSGPFLLPRDGWEIGTPARPPTALALKPWALMSPSTTHPGASCNGTTS